MSLTMATDGIEKSRRAQALFVIHGRGHQSFRRSGCMTTSSAFACFCARFFFKVHEYGLLDQAIVDNSIARVKWDMSVY